MMTTVPTISKVLDKKRKVILNGFINNYLRFSRSSEYTKFIVHVSKLVRIIFIHALAWFRYLQCHSKVSCCTTIKCYTNGVML